MTTIQGSIAKLSDNSLAMFEKLGYVTSNIANYNTNAYKAQRFETYLNPDGTLYGKSRVDYSGGALVVTLRDLDVGVDGAGFIPVTNKQGETCYTRDGSFSVNSEGYLVTPDGWLVGSGIKIPASYEKIKISKDGSINVLTKKAAEFQKVGQIPLVVFNNPEGLDSLEGNKVKPTVESGDPKILLNHTCLVQGKLEKANVDLYGQINDTLKINGSIMSSTRLVKLLDDIYRQSISLRQ